MRVLGFLTGTALIIGAMVAVLGSPELRGVQQLAPVAVTAQRRELPAAAEAPVALPGRMSDVPMADTPTEAVVEDPLPETRVDEPAGIETPMELVADIPQATGLQEPGGSTAEWPGVPTTTPTSGEPASSATAPDEPDVPLDATPEADTPAQAAHWQSIWNPFRSQIAANGFAARLAAVTDIDYRVVRLKPGAYQVAFAYTEDGERAAKLAQIQGATGLDLPEAVP